MSLRIFGYDVVPAGQFERLKAELEKAEEELRQVLAKAEKEQERARQLEAEREKLRAELDEWRRIGADLEQMTATVQEWVNLLNYDGSRQPVPEEQKGDKT